MEKRIPELDGLRAIAILLVIAWHYIGIPGGPGSLFWRIFYLGHFGVDLFFVLSGFLIGSILINLREAPNYFRAFYTRRALRIWPLYYLMVFLLLVGHAGRFSDTLFEGTVPGWTYLLLIQNFWMARLQTYGAFWLGGTWSLAIEEQFYLLFPLVVRFVPIRHLPKLLIAIILICPVMRFADAFTGDQFSYYVLPYYRADVLSIGALIAWLRIHQKTHLVPSTLILLVSSCLVPLILWAGSETFPAAAWEHTLAGIFFGAALLVTLGRQGASSLRCLRSRPAAFFAKTSYCAYLIHHWVALLIFASLHVGRAVDTPAGSSLTVLSFIATFLIAAASYRWLEAPLLRLGHGRFSSVSQVASARLTF